MLAWRNVGGLLVILLLALFSQQVWSEFNNDTHKVRLRLLWHHQFQFAGYYIAKEKGYYSASGLDVDITEFENGINNIDDILHERSEFAIGRSNIIIDKAQGADIVALYATFQSSPLMLLTKGFTGLNSPADLNGRRIMITDAAQKSGELLAMLAKAGLGPGDYIQQKHSFSIEDLASDKTDAIASYISNEPYRLIQLGIPYNILHPADYGFNMYSDILYTSGELLRREPEKVEKFYRASIAGWKYAFANIQETVELIYQKYNSQKRSREALLFEGHELKKLAFDSAGNFGTLTPYRLQAMSQVYLLTGFLNEEPNLDSFIYYPPVKQLNLSYEEIEYIKNEKSINICVQAQWQPFEKIEAGRYKGIIADLLDLIRDKSGLSFKFTGTESRQQAITLSKQGICDATTIYHAAQKDKDILVTDPLTNITHAFLIADENLSPAKISSRVGILNQEFCNDCSQNLIPAKTVIKINNPDSAIEQLREGHIDSLYASTAQLRMLLSNQDIDDLFIHESIISESGFSLAMNHHHPVLLGILNKAINAITQKERDRIFNQRMIAVAEHHVNQSIYWVVIGLIGLVSLFFIYRFYLESLRNKILKELSETDQLTQVANRRKAIDEINKYIELSTRYQNNLSLVYFDVDDFKTVNDQFSHETGDQLLIELAQLVQESIRKTDVFARFGGEEFVILSPESTIEDCKKLVSGLQNKILHHQFSIDHRITCSFGITGYRPEESRNNFIKRADHAMYQAKNSGKNTIVTTP